MSKRFLKNKIRNKKNDNLGETNKVLKMYDEEMEQSHREMERLISKKKPIKHRERHTDDDSVFSTFDDTSATVQHTKKTHQSNEKTPHHVTEAPKFSLNDLRNAIVLRKKLVSWLGSPVWDWAIKNVYVVVKAFDSKAEYKIGQVLKTKKTNPYQVEDKETNLELELKIGRTIKTFSMNHVSNTPLNEHHFKNWINEMNRVTVPLPSLETLRRIHGQIKKAENYTWTEEDVEKSIAKNKKKFINITKRRLYLNQLINSNTLTKDEKDEVINELKELEKLDEDRRQKTKQVDSQQLRINKISKETNKKRIAKLKSYKRQRETTSDPLARIVTSDIPSFFPNKKRKVEEQKEKNEEKVEEILHNDFDINIDLSQLGNHTNHQHLFDYKQLVRPFHEDQPKEGNIKVSIYDLL